jgi:DNA invertase Pin-like site-specific DNA recombinase
MPAFPPVTKISRARNARLQAAGAYRVFEDVISGKTFERTGLADLFDHLRPVDSLAVVRLGPFSLRELLDVVEDLQKREVALLSLEEKLDSSSAAGELVFHVFGALAQFERRLIAERTRDGMNAARAKGSRPGRPPLNPEKLEAALLLVKGGMSPPRPPAEPRSDAQRSTAKSKRGIMPEPLAYVLEQILR